MSAVCLTSYTASVLTLIGSAFIVSQIPGVPLSTSVSSLSDSVPRTSVLETTINSTVDEPVTKPSSVDILTTSFILASISSCPSKNHTESTVLSCDNTSYSCQIFLTNRTDNVVCELDSGWAEFILEWIKYANWHWWKTEFANFISSHTQNETKYSELTNHKSAHHSRLKSHSAKTEDMTDVQDAPQEWIAEIQNWLDQAALERSSHTRYFPLEISTSNY